MVAKIQRLVRSFAKSHMLIDGKGLTFVHIHPNTFVSWESDGRGLIISLRVIKNVTTGLQAIMLETSKAIWPRIRKTNHGEIR